VDNAANVGTYLLQRLHALAASHPVITAVRGWGLMVAIDLATDAAPVVDACRAQGLLVNAVQAATLRLVPPLIVTPADVDEAIEILGTVLAALPQPATA
jgi:acetylornithine/N-succinyldiaminopimelate aminotransferase